MSERRLLLVPSMEMQERALSALKIVADEYGLAALKKPCVAFLLDGGAGGADRHSVAFIIALECRAMECSEEEAERVLTRWAQKIGYRPQEAHRAIKSAYMKVAGGRFRYYAPGRRGARGR
jgi:hypothetical protein